MMACMTTSTRDMVASSSAPPEGDGDGSFALDGEPLSESGSRSALPVVALAVSDAKLRDSLFVLVQRPGRVVGNHDMLPVATVVITDIADGAAPTLAGIRARARSGAALIVILARSDPVTEVDSAYRAGAVLCLRAPVDESAILAAVSSAIELQAAKDQASSLERQLDVQAHLASLGRVTAGFTHEVSSPLAALRMHFELVQQDVDLLLGARHAPTDPGARATAPLRQPITHASADDLRAGLDGMAEAIDRIDAILALTRVFAQRGRLSTRICSVQLSSVVRDVLRWAAGDLRGVEVQEQIDETVLAHADARLLGQILLNFVTNAALAARQLKPARVRVHVYGSSHRATVSVRDNGPGIPDSIRDRIFEPFFTTRRGQGGTGLGLAVCREYASQMHARIRLWTAPGRGACFRLHMRRDGGES
jgi:signal transduction histidine kinase